MDVAWLVESFTQDKIVGKSFSLLVVMVSCIRILILEVLFE